MRCEVLWETLMESRGGKASSKRVSVLTRLRHGYGETES